MDIETRKRIRAYKKALPELRERVIAVALLLAMSASMLTSASFAWITLSRAPEVTGMQTTVAANGNLEIALAHGSTTKLDEENRVLEAPAVNPDESAVGDAASEKGIVGANITWGNLVNVSDPIYGLNRLSLRPALLSDWNRNTFPLYGATYGKDGRVIAATEQYEYSSWKVSEQRFDARNVEYGVRAISSIKYTNVTGNAAMEEMWEAISREYTNAKGYYFAIVEGDKTVDKAGQISCMDALSGLLETFAQEKADNVLSESTEPIFADYSGHVTYFYETMKAFKDVLDSEGVALLNLANLQAYLDDSSRGTMTFSSVEDLLSKERQWTSLGVQLESLATFKSNYNTLKNDLEGSLKQLAVDCDPANTTTPPVVKWNEIKDTVNHFVDINSAKLDSMKISTMGSKDISTLANIAMWNSKNNPSSVEIEKGILKDTEQRIGARMKDRGVMVSIHINAMGMNKDVYALVKTTAEDPYSSVNDRMNTQKLQGGTAIKGEDPEAKDTYGMAIDIWLRTNAENSVVTLEGQVLDAEVDAYGIDKNGNETQLFVMSVPEDGDFDVYKLDNVYYYANTHQEVGTETQDSATFAAKKTEVRVGYEGENRVWEDWETKINAGLVEQDSTTQGSGSCFVFYANPTEQENILDLLDSFSIAFLDSEGEELAKGVLNTERYYAINGKVTVPLEIIQGKEYVELDENGNEIARKGITSLVQNEPKFITAVIYLDGMRLQNQNVLATGEIQGQLNLQFGSSTPMDSVDDRELQAIYRRITAEATAGNQTSSTTDSPITFDYDGTPKAVCVTLDVEGEQPSKISGFFIRSINSSQGTREETEIFTKNADGTWSADFELSTPGSYLMRSLIVDGSEYPLNSFPSVEISGLNVSSITTSLRSGTHMTAENSMSVEVTARIDAEPSLMPRQVRAVFRGTNRDEYNALMEYNETTGEWRGSVTFNSSGTYVLEYLVMDGRYDEVPENMRTTLIISLGMTSQVWIDYEKTDLTTSEFEYRGGDKTIPMKAKIFDNSGAEKQNLEGEVELFYWTEGSSLDQNGLRAVLEWKENTGYYEGNFLLTKAGRYNFNRITLTKKNSDGDVISTSTIRNTMSAVPIVAIPPDPPKYISTAMTEETGYQVDFDGTAKLSAYLLYADSAVVAGKIKETTTGDTYLVWGHKTDEEKTVTVNGEEVTAYRFDFYPSAQNDPYSGTPNRVQDGDWELMEIYLQAVYADLKPGDNDDSTTYVPPTSGALPTNDGLSYVLRVTDDVSAYVVSSLRTTFTKTGSTETYTGEAFGGTKESPTGAFMDSYEVKNVTLTVKDWNGNPIRGVTGATWYLQYDGRCGDYGGYSGAAENQRTIAMTPDSTNSVFTVPTQTFTYAGGYYTNKIEVAFGDVAKTLSYSPSITVASKKPTAKITGVNPGTTTPINTKLTWSVSWGTPTFTASESKTNSYSDYAATLYASATVDNSGIGISNRHGFFEEPKLKINVYGIASGYTATLKLPAGTASEVTYSRSGNGEIEKTIGSVSTVKSWQGGRHYLEGYTGHGNVSITTMTITKGTETYTVTLDNPLVITNPSSVDKLS